MYGKTDKKNQHLGLGFKTPLQFIPKLVSGYESIIPPIILILELAQKVDLHSRSLEEGQQKYVGNKNAREPRAFDAFAAPC